MPPREIEFDGLPPGWVAIERDYLSGSQAGKTYVRFNNNTHKNVCSVRAVIKLDAGDRGMDPAEVQAEYDRKKEEIKQDRLRERELKGLVDGERKNEAIEHFRAVHGKLDGATICCLPGWKGESKLLENCGQICARYYAPDGTMYALVNQIEALFGFRMLSGDDKDVPDVMMARAGRKVDEKGKTLNVARSENVKSDFSDTGYIERPPKRFRPSASLHIAKNDDYVESESLKVLRIHPRSVADQLAVEKFQASEDRQEVEAGERRVRELLAARGFPPATELLYIAWSRDEETPGRKILEAMRGVYYQRPGNYGGMPYFQQVFVPAASGEAVLACSGIFLSWSAPQAAWKIGALDEKRGGFALNRRTVEHPADLQEGWLVWEPKVGLDIGSTTVNGASQAEQGKPHEDDLE